MHSIRPEWPLVIFTTCAPLCAGVWIVVTALALLDISPQAETLTTGIFGGVLCAVLIISLLCSTLHLGKPLKALRAFMRLGNSSISNETFMGTLFALFLLIYLVVSQSSAALSEISKILCILVAAFAGLFVLFQCLAYRMRTVPTWNSFSFSVEFAAIALLSGVCVGGALACLALPVSFEIRLVLVIVEAICCIGTLLVISAQGIGVAKKIQGRRNTQDTLSQWTRFSVVRVLAIVAGSIIWGWGMLVDGSLLAIVIIGALLVIFGIAVGRYAFYRFYINVGLPRV